MTRPGNSNINGGKTASISVDNIARIAKGLRVEPWRLLRDD
jgi:hypothetical protein